MPAGQLVNGDVDLGHLLGALRAVKRGDFTIRLPFDQIGILAILLCELGARSHASAHPNSCQETDVTIASLGRMKQ